MPNISGINSLLPPGKTWREAWDFKNINGTNIPSLIRGGHPMTLQGSAGKRTTCDGVNFTGAIGSQIDCGALHNNATTFWVNIRFKLNEAFAAGSTRQYLWSKYIDGTHQAVLYLNEASGKLTFYYDDGTGGVEQSVGGPTWVAGVWHVVTVRCYLGQTIIWLNGSAQGGGNSNNLPNGGNIIIGDLDSTGLGFKGVISRVVMGTDVISDEEIRNLRFGVPPVDAVNLYTMDEGRGSTIYDRGSGGNDGTIDSLPTWVFDHAKLSCLGLDGIGDYAASAQSVDIKGNISMIWVGKIKTLYQGVIFYPLSRPRELFIFWNDASNYAELYFSAATNDMTFTLLGSAVGATVTFDSSWSIDDYTVIIGTIDSVNGIVRLYIDGVLIGSDDGLGMIAGLHSVNLGYNPASGTYIDNSQPVLVGVVEGTLTPGEARIVSRLMDQKYNLGIGI